MSRTLQVAVGSTNPVKVDGVRLAMEEVKSIISEGTGGIDITVETVGLAVDSDVAAQPMGDRETRQGAINRALRAAESFREQKGSAPDYAVGVEGGLCEDPCFDEHGVGANTLSCMAWIAICRPADNHWGFGRSGAFSLPTKLVDMVRGGMELGDAHDEHFATVNSKQAGGTIGLLSKGRVSRAQYMQQTMMMALIPFMSFEYYGPRDSESR